MTSICFPYNDDDCVKFNSLDSAVRNLKKSGGDALKTYLPYMVMFNVPYRDCLRDYGMDALVEKLVGEVPELGSESNALDKLRRHFHMWVPAIAPYDIQCYNTKDDITVSGHVFHGLDDLVDQTEFVEDHDSHGNTESGAVKGEGVFPDIHIGQLYVSRGLDPEGNIRPGHRNFIFKREPVTREDMKILFKMSGDHNPWNGWCRVHEEIPEDFLPVLYTDGESEYMLLATAKTKEPSSTDSPVLSGSTPAPLIRERAVHTYVMNDDEETGREDEWGVVYSGDGSRLLDCKNTEIKNYAVKKDTKIICDYAFADCENLCGVTLPSGMAAIGRGAFYHCSSLADINLPAGMTSIGIDAFRRCYSLESISLPEGIATIRASSFAYCSGLADLRFPAGLTTIKKSAFYGCSGLTDLRFPSGLTSIGRGAFSGCAGLENVTLPAGLVSIGAVAFARCPSLKDPVFPPALASIGEMAFYGCTTIVNVNLPLGLASIDTGAFERCTALANVNLPANLLSIDDGTFRNCTGLSSMDFPAGLLSIGNSAFKGCAGLQKVDLPSGLKKLGSDAFSECVNLIGIDIPAELRSIGNDAFEGCGKLERVRIKCRANANKKTIVRKFERLLPESLHGVISVCDDDRIPSPTAVKKGRAKQNKKRRKKKKGRAR